MLFNWTKEDSFNLKRIADALCKIASIEVLNIGQQSNELKIEVNDESLELIAAREAEERSMEINSKLKVDNSNAFWPEDRLTLEELEDLQG